MKILYGVQGTGNGHISRARAMAKAFVEYPNIEIDWLFTGRNRDAYFDMELFGDFQHRAGLSFCTHNGKVNYLQTALGLDLPDFIQDVRKLDLSAYDQVICDFEPVTAWAARLQRRDCIGIGHQYAFQYNVPMPSRLTLPAMILRWFAPVSTGVGLHWSHFGNPILPPIVDLTGLQSAYTPNKVIVYLPFENLDHVSSILRQFGSYDFFIYHPDAIDIDDNHLHLRKLCHRGFKNDLGNCDAVISNAGFELISEALQLGKRILVKPLGGQLEQKANALALSELGYAAVTNSFDERTIGLWLSKPGNYKRQNYPDVAGMLARWLAGECKENLEDLATELWSATSTPYNRPGCLPGLCACFD